MAKSQSIVDAIHGLRKESARDFKLTKSEEAKSYIAKLDRKPRVVAPTFPSLDLQGIDIELSDFYETLPIKFQQKVSKINPQLKQQIEFYQQGVEQKVKPT